jgi:hypothetical protein
MQMSCKTCLILLPSNPEMFTFRRVVRLLALTDPLTKI